MNPFNLSNQYSQPIPFAPIVFSPCCLYSIDVSSIYLITPKELATSASHQSCTSASFGIGSAISSSSLFITAVHPVTIFVNIKSFALVAFTFSLCCSIRLFVWPESLVRDIKIAVHQYWYSSVLFFFSDFI